MESKVGEWRAKLVEWRAKLVAWRATLVEWRASLLIESEYLEDKADGRWWQWRSRVRAWCVAMWSLQQACSS